MNRWHLETVEGFASRLKKTKKRHPDAVRAVFSNVDKYLTALNQGSRPRQIRAGFIHPERKGVISIDQSGSDGTQLRLYVHPENFTVYLITIGDKRSQEADIERSHAFVKRLRRKQ